MNKRERVEVAIAEWLELIEAETVDADNSKFEAFIDNWGSTSDSAVRQHGMTQ